MVEAVTDTQTAVVANFRPEYAPVWLRCAHVETLALAPLDLHRVESMLCARIADTAVARELAARICGQVGGNPFFVEEFVESLAEQGTLQGERGRLMLAGSLDAIAVPATVESVIAARIDRLAEASKQVLRIASVVGGTFRAPILQELTDQSGDDVNRALYELCRSELLTMGTADGEYTFKHPVTKHVAYDSQLRTRRTAAHARVAGVYAAAPGAKERDAALSAHHFELAERRADAARWNIRAAEVAGGWDSAQTMRHLYKARELAGSPQQPDLRELAIGAGVRALAYGVFARIDRSEVDQIFGQTRALIADERSIALAALHAWYSNGLDNAEESDADEHARSAQELAEASDHPLALLTVAWAVLRFLSDAGRLREALEFGQQALARVNSEATNAALESAI